MTNYNLPDKGSKEWHASPLNPAVDDLSKRAKTLERRASLNATDIATVSAAAAAAQAAANAAQTAAQNAQATADGAITTYYLASPPWANGSVQPVATFGDLWFDTATKLAYRWDNTNWVLIRDPVITQSLTAAQNAQTTADGKITAYYQISAPTAAHIGDLWYDTDDKNKTYYCSFDGPPPVWTTVRDGTIADAQATANTALTTAQTDALAPSSSPLPTATGGAGAVYVAWNPVANRDPVKFRLYGSTVSGFVPGAGNLIITTASSSYTHRPSPVDYAATYYYRLVEFDADGAAAASAEVSAQMIQINSPDIAASYIYAGNIFVDQLTGGTLASDILLSSIISTRPGGTGAGTDITPNGITIYDSAGTPATVLRPAGSSFKGDVEAGGLTVTGSASFRSNTNEISRNASLLLQSSTTAPSAAPSVIVDWEGVTINGRGYGLISEGANWLIVSDRVGSDPTISVWSFPKTGGAGTLVINPATFLAYRPWSGITKIGTNYYGLVEAPGDPAPAMYLYKHDASWAYQAMVTYTPIAGLNGSSGSVASGLAPATLGTDGTNLIIGEFDAANHRFRIQTYNATTLALMSTMNTSAQTGFNGPVTGIARGNFDFGSERTIIMTRTSPIAWAFNSSGTYMPGDSFTMPTTGLRGLAWDGTNFFSTAEASGATQKVYKHTGISLAGAPTPQTWYATSTWYDSRVTGGTHETDMGPVASFPMNRRARVTLTSPTIPDQGGTDDPDTVRFYLGATNTVRTNLWKHTDPAAGIPSATYSANAFSGTNPPAANNFPVSTPALIKNPASTLSVGGDGAGKFVSLAIGPTPVLALTQLLQAACSSDVNLTSTEVDITGATLTFNTVRPNAQYMCIGSFYFAAVAASTAVGSGKLSVDGVVQPAFANFSGATVQDRTNSEQTWIGTLAAVGSHTLKLRGVTGAAASTHRVSATATTITVMVFE